AMIATLLLGLAAPAGAGQQPAQGHRSSRSEPALRLEAGAVSSQQLVGVGRDVIVQGQALADVAALDGSVEVSGQVTGDVVVMRGDVRLASTARVGGDIFVVGGTVRAAPGAHAGGRMVSYPTASNAWMTLLEGPSLGLGFASRLVVGAKLALMAAWAALLLLFFAASGRQLLETADGVRREPFRSFFVGLTGVVSLVLTGLFFSAFARGLIGVPLLILVVILALVLKLWGMVAVFYALGDWVSRHLLRRRFRPLNAATIGLLVLGAVKFLPWFGVVAWTTATFIGIGAALSTKFGRHEPWFELA
ncbi:MAG TPA: polymer-forming cytoskeletal protein, partial [Thermoanaerobaculia bacterium]|nr:polymer-forming cytoskeletal protein [Thermoanaerobaculia bacterium]